MEDGWIYYSRDFGYAAQENMQQPGIWTSNLEIISLYLLP